MNRQMLIVIIALMAVLYGATDYLWLSHKTPVDQKKVKIEAANAFLAQKSRLLYDAVLSKREVYLIRKANTEWPRNIFLSSASATTVKTSQGDDNKNEEETPLHFVYSGFLTVMNKKMAVINGIEYESGETIREGGYHVKFISPEYAVIGKAGVSDISLPFQEVSPQGVGPAKPEEKKTDKSHKKSKAINQYMDAEQVLMVR